MGDRVVSAHLEGQVVTDSDVVLAIGVSNDYHRTHEHISATLDGADLDITDLDDGVHGRLHMLMGIGQGRLVVDYEATVSGFAAGATATDLDSYRFVRPSRYCQSDELGPFARAEFSGLSGAELLPAVSSWVGAYLDYVPGSSRPTDGAVATLLAREGVCRDYAHLTTALLRANGIPARVVSVYAPGLDPMDFHAVTEVCLDRSWYVVDPTCLAPRSSMVRISTGVDATDTAFMSTLRGQVDLDEMMVTAYVTGTLPTDDVRDHATIR